jgi:hypothetical protein
MTPCSRFDADPEAEATMEALRRRYQPQPRERHFGWLGLLIAVFLGYLFAHFSDRNRSAPDSAERYRLPAAIASPMPSPTPVVRDYAPRAELVQNDFAPRPVGGAFGVQMPDGRHVRTTVRYAVVSQNDLPLSGNHIGDARYVASDKHWYVWLIQSANSAPARIDP